MSVIFSMAALLIAGLISIHMKQDDNWDLQNYHIYTAFSLLNGRLTRDLWADHLQVYFNPLLDLPYYLAACVWLPNNPRWVAFLAGMPFGAAMLLVGAINLLVLSGPSGKPRYWYAALASIIGITGSTVTAEIGTTFGDIPVSLMVLTGLLALLATSHAGSRWIVGCGVAGLCLGMAAGLKLTAAIYAPPLGLAILIAPTPGKRLQGATTFVICWLIAFVAPVWWWGVQLTHVFGSPVFPMLNNIFRSPWATTASSMDLRFRPHTLLQVIFYPFYWLSGRSFVVIEGPVRDPRFAAAYLSLACVAGRAALQGTRLPRRTRLLLVFVVGSFILWEAVFSILRYAMPIEMLTGTCIALGLWSVLQTTRCAIPILAGLLVFTLAFQKTNDVGRLKHYGIKTFDVHAPSLPDRAAVAVLGHPLSFVVPFLQGSNIMFVGLAHPPATELMARAVSTRFANASSVYALTNKGSAPGETALHLQGWNVDHTQCAPVTNPFQAGISLCPTTRRQAASGNTQFIEPGLSPRRQRP